MHEKRLIKAVYCPKSCCISLIETEKLNIVRKSDSIYNITCVYRLIDFSTFFAYVYIYKCMYTSTTKQH